MACPHVDAGGGDEAGGCLVLKAVKEKEEEEDAAGWVFAVVGEGCKEEEGED